MITRRTMTAALAGVLVAWQAQAGSISITTTQRPTYADGTLTVALTIANSGDEAAHSVSPVLRFRDASVRGERRPELAPGQQIEDELVLEVGELANGRWTYSVAVDYADANQYPFQALQMGSVDVGSLGPAKVAATKVTAEPITDGGELAIDLKNLSGEQRVVQVTTHVPEGLEVSRDVGEVTLEGWAERKVMVPLINRTALPGSRYPVFVSLEYDTDEGHYGVVAQGVVEIVSKANAVERHGDTFRLLAIGLAIVFVLLIGLRLLRR